MPLSVPHINCVCMMGHLLSSPWKGLKVTEILPGHTVVLVQWQSKSRILSQSTPDAILSSARVNNKEVISVSVNMFFFMSWLLGVHYMLCWHGLRCLTKTLSTNTGIFLL